MTVSEARRRLSAPTVGDALWAGLIAVYLLVRLPAVTQMPVASVELHDLTAVWRAHVGNSTTDFQPTLAQAVTLLSFEWTDSEQFTRWVVFAAGATVPFGILALRHRLGEVGAIVAILVLALNGPAIYLGSSASAVAFDLPIVIWGLVWLDRAYGPEWWWLPAGFLIATAGPLAGAFVLAAGLVHFAKRGDWPARKLGIAGAGALVGLAASSVRFGLGWDGLAVPPLHHLANGYGSGLKAGSVGLLVPLYMIPSLAGGVAGVALHATRWRREGARPTAWWNGILAWWGLTMIWLVSSPTSGSPVPLAAVAMPSALLAGFALDAWTRRVDEFEWRLPLLAFGAAGAALVGTGVVLSTWARKGEAGDARQLAILVLTLLAAFGALSLVAVGRRTMPTLVVAAVAPLAALMFVGAAGVAFGGVMEPLFSPKSEQAGRDLRTLARDSADEIGGSIVVHPSLDDDLTWAFRGLPSYVLSSGPTLDAAVVVLPLDSPAPSGFTPLANERTLITYIDPPSSLLQYIRWLTKRNSLESTALEVAVYLRTVE